MVVLLKQDRPRAAPYLAHDRDPLRSTDAPDFSDEPLSTVSAAAPADTAGSVRPTGSGAGSHVYSGPARQPRPPVGNPTGRNGSINDSPGLRHPMGTDLAIAQVHPTTGLRWPWL